MSLSPYVHLLEDPCEGPNVREPILPKKRILQQLYIGIYIYIPEKGGDEASLWLRGCSQGRPRQRIGVQEELMGNIKQRLISWGEVDIAATLIGGRNGK